MNDIQPFAWLVLLMAGVGLVAVLSNQLVEHLRVPTPGLFLAGAAVAVHVVPSLDPPNERTILRLVTIAILVILFDGGMHIGWRSFRATSGPIVLLGLVGTFLTMAATAVVCHVGIGLGWYPAVLVAAAVAPTDPAVVFSVLGQREVAGRSGIILQGESGANDPVGIAVMASLIAAGSLSAAAATHAAVDFTLQMVIGVVAGIAGGRGLLWFIRRVPLPSEGLYPLRTLASVFVLYGVTTLAHGSGFLAVFIAGVLIGDARAPYKVEIQRFHSALASLAEIVAFVALGLTVNLSQLARPDVWVPGLVIAVTLTLVIRPLLVGVCLVPARLRRNEAAFVLLTGLKGAVPILLGSYLLTSHLGGAERLYGIVVVVAAFSVIVQGALVPAVARWLQLPMRAVTPEPWALGVRLSEEPEGVHRITIDPGSAADGCAIDDLPGLPSEAWISLVVRDRQLVSVQGETVLRAGDQILVLAPPEAKDQLTATFEKARTRPA